ncbi:MAG: hypothetical protein ACRDYZ_07600, partial [Acidimicrobiales bacterium]
HTPKTIAILGVLSYRLVNFWLPIPMGGAAYLSLRIGPGARRRRTVAGGPPATSVMARIRGQLAGHQPLRSRPARTDPRHPG